MAPVAEGLICKDHANSPLAKLLAIPAEQRNKGPVDWKC